MGGNRSYKFPSNKLNNMIKKIIDGKQYVKVIYCLFPIWLEYSEDDNVESECEMRGIYARLAMKIDDLTRFGQSDDGFMFMVYEKGDWYILKATAYLKQIINSRTYY